MFVVSSSYVKREAKVMFYCAMTVTDKLRLNQKMKQKNTFWVNLASLYDEEKVNKETESIFHYGCII